MVSDGLSTDHKLWLNSLSPLDEALLLIVSQAWVSLCRLSPGYMTIYYTPKMDATNIFLQKKTQFVSLSY